MYGSLNQSTDGYTRATTRGPQSHRLSAVADLANLTSEAGFLSLLFTQKNKEQTVTLTMIKSCDISMVFMNELTCMGNLYEEICCIFLCKCISSYMINYIPHPYSLKRKRLRDELLFLGTACIWLAQQSHFAVMSNFLPWSAFIKIASLRSTVMKCNHLSSSLHTGPRCVATHSGLVDAAPFVILRHGEFPTWKRRLESC